MPKSTLHFNLDDEYEKAAHVRALKADKAYGALYDILQYFRSVRKYSTEEESKIQIVSEVEDKVLEIINESGVDIYEEYK